MTELAAGGTAQIGWTTADNSCPLRDLRWVNGSGVATSVVPTQLGGVAGGGEVWYDWKTHTYTWLLINDAGLDIDLSDVSFEVLDAPPAPEELMQTMGTSGLMRPAFTLLLPHPNLVAMRVAAVMEDHLAPLAASLGAARDARALRDADLALLGHLLATVWDQIRQAVALDPDYPQAHYQLSRLYLEQDRARDAVREVLGALTWDPSAMLESRLYARSEVTARVGSQHLDAHTSGQASEGRLSYFASGMYEDSTVWRPVNQDRTERFLEVMGGHQCNPERQLVFYSSWFDTDAGLPGPVTPGSVGDPDDRLSFTGCDALVAWRQRLSPDVSATLKYTYRNEELGIANPGALISPDTSPFRRLDNGVRYHMPEIRLEAGLDESSRLRAGYAWQFADEEQSGVVGVVDPDTAQTVFEPFASSRSPDTQSGWVEIERRVSDRLSVLAGGRWGREEGSAEVLLPKLVALYRPDPASWLALTLEPIFRTDIAELASVEPLADPFGLRYLNFTEGGAARSWTLRYQRAAGPEGTVTGALAWQDVEGLLIDTQDPSMTALAGRTLVGDGRHWIADASYEQWLGAGVTGRLWARWQDSEGDFPELALRDMPWPYVPEWQAGGRVDYLDRAGWRVGLEGIWVGERPHDPARTTIVPDYFVLNLNAQYQRTLHENYFIQVRNVTDQDYQGWLGFPQMGFTIYGGVQYRY
ncbi:MAG: hypothetical protein AB7Y46_18780 [Armatimonadota bacterium]